MYHPWMRTGVLVSTAVAMTIGASAAAAATPTAPRATVVGCDEVAMVADPVTPDLTYERIVLDHVALARPTIPHQLIDGGPRRYWIKMGLLVRLGRGPVEISVPPAWRDRVLIGWGYPNLHGPSLRLRIERCPLPDVGEPYSDWLVYAGGIHYDERACVPLTVRLGGRTATVRFNLGKPCR